MRTINSASPVEVQQHGAMDSSFSTFDTKWLMQSRLPSSFDNKRIMTTTLLRDPVERIRSYYYYVYGPVYADNANRDQFRSFLALSRDYVAGNMTRTAFGKQQGQLFLLLRGCCEYETWLGDGSVEKAKLTLATQFNLVGITERMNEGLVSVGKLYGLTPTQAQDGTGLFFFQSGVIHVRILIMMCACRQIDAPAQVGEISYKVGRDLDNRGHKLDWAADELAMATYVATKGNLDVC